MSLTAQIFHSIPSTKTQNDLKNRKKTELTGLRTHRPRNPRPRIPSRPRPRRRQRPSRPPRTAGAATGTGGTSWECGGGRTEGRCLLDRRGDRMRLTNSRTEEEAKSNIFLFLVRECFISMGESTLSPFFVAGKSVRWRRIFRERGMSWGEREREREREDYSHPKSSLLSCIPRTSSSSSPLKEHQIRTKKKKKRGDRSNFH